MYFSSNYYVRIELLDKKRSIHAIRKKNLVYLQRDIYSSTAVGFSSWKDEFLRGKLYSTIYLACRVVGKSENWEGGHLVM